MRTLLLVDDKLDVEVESSNDKIATEVEGADEVEGIRVIEGDSLGDLGHTKDDGEVDAVAQPVSIANSSLGRQGGGCAVGNLAPLAAAAAVAREGIAYIWGLMPAIVPIAEEGSTGVE